MNDVQLLVLIALLILAAFIAYKVIKYRIKHKIETITCFTGGLGSGKTLMSVDIALKIYRKQIRKWKFKRLKLRFLNLFRKEKEEFLLPKPLFFSNIPVLLNKKRKLYSHRLTREHLLLQERIPLNSVILLDEIGAFASQFDFKEKNVINVFDEFVRFYRHYTQGGYIVCNDQCSENINLVIRRRVNLVHNLCNCLVIWRFCFFFERMISISEEIKTIDVRSNENDKENDTQNNMVFRFKFLWNKGMYDTYCYSGRYDGVPQGEYHRFKGLKTLALLKCPKDKEKIFAPKTLDEDRKESK